MKDNYQELFSYMVREHGVTLLLTETQDLVDIVEKTRWIKVEHELPPLKTHVIGYVVNLFGRKQNYVSEVYFSSQQKWLMEENYECTVTHWMPLPEPPEV